MYKKNVVYLHSYDFFSYREFYCEDLFEEYGLVPFKGSSFV